MLYYTGLLLLVIAVSLDGFGVGISYGMRKIQVPASALAIIMSCSGIIVLLSMTLGGWLSTFISPELAKTLGGSVLISLGFFSLYNTIRSTVKRDDTESLNTDSNTTGLQNIKTVLTTPDQADLDKSGNISPGEALLLGSALALDAFAAGIGAAILGYSPLTTAVMIAFMSGLFLSIGIHIGILLSKSKRLERMSFVPPVLLITLGILNIF
ncbi:sporulation membrane protein YtaF [Virgibacillus sp. LDC-1]|uniref:sporulation membrane protein YtaF n=1 Tax=Virgibacillus sp. LDC-1 TaxID=3039856 RepID=UPI0024DEC226|nr:sporulation membrane protein YtaF [Virgibacillus sp. LDC-1]